MSWTAIDADTSWQDLAVAQEIADAYNARRAVCGLSQIATPDQSTAVYDFILAVQTGIEGMAPYFANPSLGDNVAGLMSNFTLAGAMTYAGLTVNGYWRRIADGGSQPSAWTNYAAAGWAYGKIQSKDLAGPWLWKDLQLALSALTRRLHAATLGEHPDYYATASKFISWGNIPHADYWPSSISGDVSPTAHLTANQFGAYCQLAVDRFDDTYVQAIFTGSVQRGYASISGLGTESHNVRMALLLNSKSGTFTPRGIGASTVGYRYFSSASITNSTSDTAALTVLGDWFGDPWSTFRLWMADWPPLPSSVDGWHFSTSNYYFDTTAQWVIDYDFWD